MRWAACVDDAVRHALHLAALRDLTDRELHGIRSGYGREDRRLRQALGHRAPSQAALAEAAPASAAAALGNASRPTLDRAWVDVRSAQGERASCAEAAQRLAREATDRFALREHVFPGDDGPDAVCEIIASPAVDRVCAARLGPWRTAASPRSRIEPVVLTALGARIAPAAIRACPRLASAPAPVLRLVTDHAAGAWLMARCATPTDLDAWLTAAVAVLTPTPADARTYEDDVRALAEMALDQPPGEVERILQGLLRRRPDRLHRAWLRGVFIPTGLDVEAALGAPR